MITITIPPFSLLLLGYLTIINLITFVIYGLDKARAKATIRRIPERTLLTLALLGGSPAALIGMQLFRHKTKKADFGLFLAVIILLQLAFLLFLYRVLGTTLAQM